MPSIYFVHKNNPLARSSLICNNFSSLRFAEWNLTEKHTIKRFIENGEYLDQNFNVIRDYLLFECEYETHTFLYNDWHFKRYIIAYHCFNINRNNFKQCLLQFKNHLKLMCYNYKTNNCLNTDPFFFTNEWYYAICKK